MKWARYMAEGAGAAAAAGISYLFGCVDLPLGVLAAFMVMDYITGVLAAVFRHKLSSRTGMKGLVKKATIILVLIMAVFLDRLINSGEWIFRTVTCYFYIANEGISILENCGELGVRIPRKVQSLLSQLRESQDKGEK